MQTLKCLELDIVHSRDTVGIGPCVLGHCNCSLRNYRTCEEKQKKLGKKISNFDKKEKI